VSTHLRRILIVLFELFRRLRLIDLSHFVPELDQSLSVLGQRHLGETGVRTLLPNHVLQTTREKQFMAATPRQKNRATSDQAKQKRSFAVAPEVATDSSLTPTSASESNIS
jgi:hypothetical protein